MENLILVIVGLSLLACSGLVLFKLAPRDGQPVHPWLEGEGAATVVSLALTLGSMVGIALLFQALID